MSHAQAQQRLEPALPTCTCAHTAAAHYPRNLYDAEAGIKPCWVCGCAVYTAGQVVGRAGAIFAWLVETYGTAVDQSGPEWERDAGALLAIVEATS